MTEFHSLNTFLGGYLNEDCFDEYGTPWRAVEAFVRHEPEYAPLLRSEIVAFTSPITSEAALKHCLIRMGLGYAAEADGWGSYREWLLAVADRVDELLRGQPPEPPDRPRSGSAQV